MKLWQKISITGGFAGIAPLILRLAIDLTQGRKTADQALDRGLLLGILLFAILGGVLSLLMNANETDLKKVFQFGLGIPSLLTVGTQNITSPIPLSTPAQTANPPGIHAPPGGGQDSPNKPTESPQGSLFIRKVFAQMSVRDRKLIIGLPSEVTGPPVFAIFEPTGSYASVIKSGESLDVPDTAISFKIESQIAESDSVKLPTQAGSVVSVRFRAEKKPLYGLLYSLGIKKPPYTLFPEIDQSQPVVPRTDPLFEGLQLKATARKRANEKDRYDFKLALDLPRQYVKVVARAHYDLVYAPNSLALDSSRPPDFPVAYEGWGCYNTVVVTTFPAQGNDAKTSKTFNMCSVLGWQ